MNPLDPIQTTAGNSTDHAAEASGKQPAGHGQGQGNSPGLPTTTRMTARPKFTAVVSFLVPSAALPSEGEEVALPELPAADAPRHQWLRLLEVMVGPCAPRFAVDPTGVRPVAEPNEADATLRLAHLGRNAAGNAPVITVSPISTMIEWPGVLAATARQTESEHYLGGINDAVRIFIAATGNAAREACDGLSRHPLPLFALQSGGSANRDTPVILSFIGLLLVPEDELHSLRHEIPAKSWSAGPGAEFTTCLMVDESEVEGHGLREAISGAALMAMVLGSAPSAQANMAGFLGLKPKEPISQVAMHYGLTGEVLSVKSQKLAQPAPRIYNRGLAQAANSERLVIVDINAQRAYLFVNGNLVFDTPVSTASKGRYTPRGTYAISEKIKSGKHSTLYGSPMPYWQRLGESAIGMHTGQLPGYPASHGCVRMPDESARFMFDSTKQGTTVQIVNQWTPPAQGNTLLATR